MDIQGFYWNQTTSREQFRLNRLKNSTFSLHRYQSMRKSQIQKQIQSYFTFKYTSRTEFCTVPPIPLRKTIQCVSEHQILYTFDSALYCYNQILGESEEILSSSNSRLSSISVVESSDNFIFVCDVRGKLLAITDENQSFISSILSNPIYNISLNCNGNSFFLFT